MVKINLDGRKKTIRAIVFDMDNTLFDLVEAKREACRKVTEYIGINDGMELFNYFLREEVGFEDVNCIADYLRDRNKFEKSVFKDCQDIYETVKLENLELYNGVRETLENLKLKGLNLAIVSDANEKNVKSRLEHTGLDKFFHTTVSRDRTGRTKPEPHSIISALKDLEVNPEMAMIVGDSLDRDITPGKELGMITAHAKYGDKNTLDKRNSKPDVTLEKISDLLSYLNTMP